ncbi:hypothetical protein L1049_020092 [Liquidambar formosana]|uniref:Acid phosphatase n=1 Tax=Liquidambar formosana TaxID=63359 RepID=A0AAP0X3D8_LIQFO
MSPLDLRCTFNFPHRLPVLLCSKFIGHHQPKNNGYSRTYRCRISDARSSLIVVPIEREDEHQSILRSSSCNYSSFVEAEDFLTSTIGENGKMTINHQIPRKHRNPIQRIGRRNSITVYELEECAEYVKDYITRRAYAIDLNRVSKEAGLYAKSIELGGDGKDVWVFDVDETLLSHLPYYAEHGYGLEVFDSAKFDKWVDKAMAPAIESSLELYEEVLSLGFKVFLLTGRSEKQRDVTVENLMKAGFRNWDKLILR